MRRCTSCFRFQVGKPTFCVYCGRSFDGRRCPRGHLNSGRNQFCAECGSPELSTSMPAPSFLYRVSGATLSVFGWLFVLLLLLSAGLAALKLVDWASVQGPLLGLLAMLGFLYWTTTLLPGPVKRVGKSAAQRLIGAKNRKERR